MSITDKQREWNRQWRQANRDKTREYNKRWRAKNPQRGREDAKLWRKRNPQKLTEQRRRWYLKRRYKMLVSQFGDLLTAQGHRCASCQSDLTALTAREIHIDHCHTGGHVRGILCQPCNLALGHSKEDPARLRGLADYIERCGQPHSLSSVRTK